MKPGYKQTEVGAIPEDWEVKSLSEIASFKNGINKGKSDFGHGYPFVNLMDVFGIPKIYKATSELGLINTNAAERELYNLKGGDVLFVRSSVKPAGVGLTTLISSDLPDTVFSGFLIRFRDSGHIEVGFKEHCFFDTKFRSRLISSSTVSANTNINQDSLKQLRIALPPTKIEQRAIATALSDADALIQSLERLIAKKRDIKQGAMQELLTGNKRLPGFSGEWEYVEAGDIGCFRGGSGFQTKHQGATSGRYPFFKVSDMNNEGNATFMEMANNYISETVRKQLGATAFPDKSIVFAKVGAAVFIERKKILTKVSCIDNNMAAFMLDESLAYYRFIHYVLLNKKLGDFVSTTALPSLSGSVLAAIEMPLPALPEQIAIATALTDMDAEIGALDSKLAKARQIKEGMMQELLTGRIRLT